jgi:hypothetical protein
MSQEDVICPAIEGEFNRKSVDVESFLGFSGLLIPDDEANLKILNNTLILH